MGDSEEDEGVNLQYKVILLGDGATGKTSIAMRFTEDVFAAQYKQTIGVDFFIKRLVLPGDVNVALQVGRCCCLHYFFLSRTLIGRQVAADVCTYVLGRCGTLVDKPSAAR